ncbi:hypothetical protein [Alloprevotella tannerae]|uniref:Uncharacterized protein n=1 Tax=Alloprevotella tannerae TaxID=76122 RepID=A0A929RXH2_9BACT|nr:hypothetical protein [Alloprevotella tannerae]MBF0969607.1 hypothetical protein [Alloprevotella tannerae]
MGASPEKSVILPYIRRRPRFLRKAAWGGGHHYYKHILPHPIRPDRPCGRMPAQGNFKDKR